MRRAPNARTTTSSDGDASQMRAAQASPELAERLDHARLLTDSRVRALWPRLEPAQQRIVLNPNDAVGHRYPLSSGEVSQLTAMSERQVRYWADRKLIPHRRQGNRRLFEAVGLIAAYSVANASQYELRFYRGLIEEPVENLAAKLGIVTSLLATRLENADPNAARALTAPLAELSRR